MTLPAGTPPLAVVEGDGSVLRIDADDVRRFRAATPYRELAFDTEGVLHASRIDDGHVVVDRLHVADGPQELLRLPHVGLADDGEDDPLGAGYTSTFALVEHGMAIPHQELEPCTPPGCTAPMRGHRVAVFGGDGALVDAPDVARLSADDGHRLLVDAMDGERLLVQVVPAGAVSTPIADPVLGVLSRGPSQRWRFTQGRASIEDVLATPGAAFASSDGTRRDRIELVDPRRQEDHAVIGELRPSGPDGDSRFAPVLAVTEDLTVASFECGPCEDATYTLNLHTHPEGKRHPLRLVEAPQAVEFARVP